MPQSNSSATPTTNNQTYITVIDRPCGFGKSTELIAEILRHKVNHPKAKILLVVPELDEITRFTEAIGDGWFIAPLTEKNSPDNKTDHLIRLLGTGKNVITTHALYEKIRLFQHLLKDYYVVIDEVPTAAKEVATNIDSGTFKLIKQKYVSIDPTTQLISANGNWLVDKKDFSTGIGKQIQKFMDSVVNADVYYVNDTYQVLPLPDAFFTQPKSLTIITFLFEGTQLDYYMSKKGYTVDRHQRCKNELRQFKAEMYRDLRIYHKTSKAKTGFANMSSKTTIHRKAVGNFIKNSLQQIRKDGFPITQDQILVASHKDAWHGKRDNKNSAVSNATSLQTIAKLSSVKYTALVTRGTNKYRAKNVLILLGKLNMNPGLAEFLGMRTKQAQISHATSELIQLIYRTAIRDKKEVFLISADYENVSLLKTFLNT